MRLSRALAPLLLLVACGLPPAAPAPRDPLPPPGEDSCGAGPRAALVGQDAEALERVLIIGQVRLIRPGTPVTEDFAPSRINFHIDAAERITAISCG